MDWSSNDYTQTYADTFYSPEYEQGEGIYVDESLYSPHDTALKCEPRITDTRDKSRITEKYNTGGNVVSTRRARRPVFNVGWDERPPLGAAPLRPQRLASHLGGDGSKIRPSTGVAHFQSATPACMCKHNFEMFIQITKVILLVIIVVMLAMTLNSINIKFRELSLHTMIRSEERR